MSGLGIADPFPALVRPEPLLFVTAVFDEVQVLPVGNQIPAGREIPDIVLLAAEFVVPAVQRMGFGFAQNDAASGDRQQLVRRRLARRRADAPQRELPHHLDRQATNDDRRRLQVNPLVLDAHQNHPERIVPVDRHHQRQGPDGLVHQRAHGVAVRLDLGQCRPVVMRRVQIVPGHFVDADSEHGFEPRIDPVVGNPCNDQLVDVEGRRVPKIENQRVPQRLGSQVEGVFRRQGAVQLLVKAVRRVKILPDFFAFRRSIAFVEDDRSGVSEIHRIKERIVRHVPSLHPTEGVAVA
jgi:hypothetical protein